MQAPSGAAHPGMQQTSSTRATAVDVHLVHMLVTITILIVALTAFVLIKATPKLYQQVIERGNQWYSFFWAASFMASFWNFFSVNALMILTIQQIQFPGMFGYEAYIIKMVMVMVCLLIFLDILVVICTPKSAEFPIPSIANCYTCCCC